MAPEGDPNLTPGARDPNLTSEAAIFRYWYKKGPWDADKKCILKYRFCPKAYTLKQGRGYGNYHKHIRVKHPGEYGIDRGQTPLSGYAYGSQQHPNLFSYGHASSTDSWAETIAVAGLSFRIVENLTLNDHIT